MWIIANKCNTYLSFPSVTVQIFFIWVQFKKKKVIDVEKTYLQRTQCLKMQSFFLSLSFYQYWTAQSEFFTERTFLSVIDNLHSIYKAVSSKLTGITYLRTTSFASVKNLRWFCIPVYCCMFKYVYIHLIVHIAIIYKITWLWFSYSLFTKLIKYVNWQHNTMHTRLSDIKTNALVII